MRSFIILCCLTIGIVTAANIRADPREATFDVLERIDSVLDKELDVLIRESNEPGTQLAEAHKFKNYDVVGKMKTGAVWIMLAVKKGIKTHPIAWFAIKTTVVVGVALAAAPLSAALTAIAVAAKVGETLITVSDSMIAFEKFNDAAEKCIVTKAMAATCKSGDAIKAVAAVFWNWCGLITPLPDLEGGGLLSGALADEIEKNGETFRKGAEAALKEAGTEVGNKAKEYSASVAEAKILRFDCSKIDTLATDKCTEFEAEWTDCKFDGMINEDGSITMCPKAKWVGDGSGTSIE